MKENCNALRIVRRYCDEKIIGEVLAKEENITQEQLGVWIHEYLEVVKVQRQKEITVEHVVEKS